MATLPRRSSKSILLFGALTTLAAASPAALQAAEALSTLEEIVVSAQRRDENLQDVPIAMTSFNDRELALRGINTLRDLDHFIPNVIQTGLDSRISGNVSIRGISSDNRNIGFDSGASMYVDGVYVGRSTAFRNDTLNIERFEVLRGPQGTLFGKNTIAGAFNVVTQKPTNQLEAHAEAQYGNYDLVRLRGSISGPLVEDKILAGLAAFNVDRDGYQTNVVDDKDFWNENQYGARATAVFILSDRLTATAAVDGMFEETRMNVYTVTVGLGSDCCGGDPRKVSIDAPVFADREISGGHVTFDYELGNGGTLTSITAARSNDVEFLSDDDGTVIPFIYSHFKDYEDQLTQELRYVSPSTARVRQVFGLYYYDQRIRTDRISVAPAGGLTPAELSVTLDGKIETQAYAAYGQVDWDITSDLTLITGLRYTDERRDLSRFDLSGLAPFGIIPLNTTEVIDDDALSWTAGLSYRLGEDTRAYAKVSSGFKSGGFNADYVGRAQLSFKPEYARAYEIGLKSELLDHRLRMNAAAFFTDYSDLQVSTYSQTLSGFVINNAAKAEIYGVELDAEAQVTPSFRLTGAIGYLDATFEEFRNAGGDGVNFDGNRMINSPEWTVGLTGQYTYTLEDAGSIYLRGEYAYRDSYFVNERNTPEAHIDGYSLVNARVGYRSANDRWTVELWSKNLTDKLYINSQSNPMGGLFGQVAYIYGQPRTYGLRVLARM